MPSTRSTSCSDGESKPNTRSKGGGAGGGGRSKATSWSCTKSLSHGQGLKKTSSTNSVNRSKLVQDPKHGDRKGNTISDSKVTTSKTDKGPVEKSKRGRKPLNVVAKETVSCLQNDNKEDKGTILDSSQRVSTPNGSADDQESSLKVSGNLSSPDSENTHLQSTNLLNGNLVVILAKETADNTEHINGKIATSVSSNNNGNSVSNSILQKDNPALLGGISPDEMYLSDAIPAANELELLQESCDDAKTNNSTSDDPNHSNSILPAGNPRNEISNGSDSVNERNVIDNLLIAQSALQTTPDVCNSDPNTANSDESSPQKTSLIECDKTPLSSKSQKSNVALSPEATHTRKSGRRSVPNRKYLDMETDFSRKKSKTVSSPEKKSVKSPEEAKASKSQNSSASTLKRKSDLNTEKTPVSKKRAIKEPPVNEREEEEEEEKKKSPRKSVQPFPKKKAVSTLVSPATRSPGKPSPSPSQKVTPPILKVATTQKSATPLSPKLVQSLPANQSAKTADLIVNNTTINRKRTQPLILVETEQLSPSANVLLTASKTSGSLPNNSALNEELSAEKLIPCQTTTNALSDASQRLALPANSSTKTLENLSKSLPAIPDSLNSSLNSESNNNLDQHIIVVHPAEPVEPQVHQKTDLLVADENLSKELPEASVPQIMVTLPDTISSSTAVQNSSLSNTLAEGPMTYSVEMAVPSTKPIISFTEGISQTSPYTVSLLNNSISKDKEAVESLINATHMAEKVNESGSVMMCLSSRTEDLVPSTMTLDVNTHHDAHRLETEAAIQELTASFPQTFSSSDMGIHEKDQITKSSISLAEAAKMVAESQTIVDLPDVSSLSVCGLEELRIQSTPAVREVSTATLPTAVASTQTPLQLPRKNLKASSLMKSLSASIHQSAKMPIHLDDDDDDEDDDDLDGDCFDNDDEIELKQVEPRKSTQEFIVVHLPEGAQIKRERVDSKHHIETLSRGHMDENGSYRCTDCNYITAKKANWYKHRKKHLGLRPHCCLKCDYKATTSSNLKRHMAIHTDLREYKCNLCSNYFRQKIHLERHMKYKHEEKKVQCPLCNYVCASENPDLKIHFKRRHVPSTYATLNSFTCDDCGLVTATKKDLKQHAKFHRRGPELKLFCEQCSFVTECESRLRRHVFTHTKVKPFKCGLCDYRGSQKEHVLRHMKSRHSIEIQRNPRRSRDDEITLDNLDRDRTDFTSRDKIFACNHCTMKFSKLINLYKHLHTQHKNIMPMGDQNEFYCVVCDFKTTSKKNLLVHMRKHNMQEQNPPSHVYSCVLCRYVNPKRRNLFQHMMKKHGIEIVMNMKDDWSLNGYASNTAAPLVLDKGESTEANIMTVGNVVTTTTTTDESNQLMVVTDDAESNTMQTVITIEDLASSMTNPVKMSDVSVNTGVTGESSDRMLADELTQQQHAADAVEGLQALAEHPRVVDHNHFKCEDEDEEDDDDDDDDEDEDEDDDDEEDDVVTRLEDIKIDAVGGVGMNNEVNVITEKSMSELDEATVSVIDQLSSEAPIKESFELTTDQVVHLSTGDYVEINGEVYKVEISTEPAEETVTTSGASDSATTELFETIVQNETTAATTTVAVAAAAAPFLT